MMKRRPWTAAMALAGATAISASAAAPKLVCDAPEYNFGKADNSTVVEHDFLLVNEGDVTLEIIKAKPSCGCTVANISTKMVEPGSNAVISASLNLRGRHGQQHKVIQVETNDPETPRMSLVLKGEATSAVNVAPRNIQGANLTKGQTVTNVIKVVSKVDEPLEIKSVVSTNPNIITQVVTIEEGKAYDVVVTTDSLPLGHTSGRITIRTSSSRLPQVFVPFRYSVVGELSVSPTEIALVSQDKAVSRMIVVGPGSVKQFSIEDVEVPHDGMKYQINPLKGNRFRIVLSNIVPGADLNGKELKILTTAQNMEEISIPFRVIQRR